MLAKHLIVYWLVIVATYCCQVYAMVNSNDRPFAAAAMTTVLARPLGGYGLTPLVFEPTSLLMQSSSSNSVPTKVRKSPVYELIMPNFDEESLPSIPITTNSLTGTKTLKKLDYESIISPSSTPQSLNNKVSKVATATDTNTVSSATNSDYYNSMLNLLKMKDSSSSSSSYNSVVAPVPSYKENLFGRTSPFLNTNQMIQQRSSYSDSPLTAAIQSIRSVEVNDVQDSYENNEPQVIDIPPSAMPIVINFRTSASQIQIHQSHEPSEQREVQETQSQDEPHFLRHSVTKPVIQEVHEIIMPYRRIIQEIRPVEEEIKTIVARGSQQKDGVGNIKGGLGQFAAGGISGNGAIKANNGSGGKKMASNFSPNALQYAIEKLTSVGSSSGNKYKS